LIDDSYSGQPDSMHFALKGLATIKPKRDGRRIALLGQMAELGHHTVSEHVRLGKLLATLPLDLIIAVGAPMEDTLAQLPKTMKTMYQETKEGLAQHLLSDILKPDDVLLVKGSRWSSRVFEVVENLIKPALSS